MRKEENMVLLGGLKKAVMENTGMIFITLAVVAALIVLAFVAQKILKKDEDDRSFKIRYIALVAMLSAISAVLMLFEFPIPFIAPGFYKIDLSEVPVIVGAFAMGPVAGVVIEFIKILLHLFIKGTSSAFVGEFGNFVVGAGFIIPASIMYYAKKTKKRAIAGLITGVITTTTVGCLVNAFILLPFYAAAFGGIDKIIAAGTAVNPMVNNVLIFCLIIVAPFNIIKFSIVSIITVLIYHKISYLFKMGNE